MSQERRPAAVRGIWFPQGTHWGVSEKDDLGSASVAKHPLTFLSSYSDRKGDSSFKILRAQEKNCLTKIETLG